MTEQSFEFKDGTSNKFWTISHSGNTYTVHFGRIGTNGQVQVKQCSSEAEAQATYHKLINEKLKKGYVRTSSGGNTIPTTTPAAASVPMPANPAPVPPQPSVAVIEKPEPPREIGGVRINLAPHDWFWAHWRDNQPLPKPQKRPFDEQQARALLHQMPASVYRWVAHWSTNRDPIYWSREESTFWQAAVLFAFGQENSTNPDCKSFGTRCDLAKFTGKLPSDYENDIDVIYRPLGERATVYARTLSIPMVMGWTDAEILQAIPEHMLRRQHGSAYWMFRVPYMTAAELASMREKLLPLLRPPVQSKLIAGEFMLAAALGMHEVVRTAIASFSAIYEDPRYNYDIPKFVFGLNNPDEVRREMSRLHVVPVGMDEVAGWLAHTEARGIDTIISSLNYVRGHNALDAIRMIGKIESFETAKVMYELNRKTDYQQVAGEWLDRFPQYSLPVIISEFEKAGKDQEAVRIMLRDYVGRIDVSQLDASMLQRLKRAGIGTEAAPRQSVDNELAELFQAAGKGKKSKLPDWTPAALAELKFGNYDLSREQMEVLLSALQQSSPESIHPLIKHLRTMRKGDVFDVFCWKLFKFWLRAGAVPKDKWAMLSVGYLGSGALLNSLLPLMYEWRETGNHQRAFYGLECFRLCGTDAAIMKVHEISQSPSLRSLRGKAVEYMQKIAEDRGMTAVELEDRIVPTCGLGEDGRREFDFGARKFYFVLSPDLKPMIKDEHGHVKSDLPAATQKDDADLAAKAHADWKAIKKELRAVAKMQAARLEQAMVTGRRWTVDEFSMFLLNHPLMSHIARRLVWAGYDENGEMCKTFRTLDDGTLAGDDDRATTLDGVQQVSIIHPFHLSPEIAARWGEVFSDYEIIAPFHQIGRPIYMLEESGARSDVITKFEKLKVPAVSIGSTLERLGWWRGSPQDGGCVMGHSKYFYRQDITAVVRYYGYYVGLPQESQDQAIEKCFFVKGRVKTDEAMERNRMPLAEVDKLIISEILLDLTTLTSKSTTTA